MVILNVIRDGVTVEHSRYFDNIHTVEKLAKEKYCSEIHSASIGGNKVEIFLKGENNPSIIDLLNRGSK